jgi:MATE family multidrug resistance protein
MGSVVILEWSFFEVLCIIVGMIQDDNQLAAHSALAPITYFYFVWTHGVSQVTSSHLGNIIGE